MATKNSKLKKARKQRAQRTVAGQKAPKRKRSRRSRAGKRSVGGVGVAYKAANMMRPMSSMTARDGHMCRFRGTDFLTAITIGGTNAAAGDVLYTNVVNPKTLGVSRLATVSALWERYKFRSLKFRYAPVAPTTTAGQLIGYVDYDTYDDPTGISGVQNLQRAAAHYGEKPVQVWQGQEKPVFWEIKDVDPLTDLYVDSDGTDPRWTNQGRFVLLAASAIASGTACGNIYLDYDVEFFIPQLEQTSSMGFGYVLSGNTSMTQSAYFGTAPITKSWSNVRVTYASNVFTLPPGNWLYALELRGTTLAATATLAGGSTILGNGAVNAAATTQLFFGYTSMPSGGTITLAGTAATVTMSNMLIAQLPGDATTLTQRRLNQVSRMLKLCGDVEQMQRVLMERADKENGAVEGKECKIQSSTETASMSAMASTGMGSVQSKIPLSADDSYFVVKRGSRLQ